MEPRLHFAIRLQDVGCLGTETASHSTLLLRWALRIPVCVCVYITLQITAFAHHFLRAKTPLGGEVISPFVVMKITTWTWGLKCNGTLCFDIRDEKGGGGRKGPVQAAFGLRWYTFTYMRPLPFRRRNFFLILAHPVYKMWIIQEPNTLELWNKLHFEEREKTESIYRV